jgi:hypothetical protein
MNRRKMAGPEVAGTVVEGEAVVVDVAGFG